MGRAHLPPGVYDWAAALPHILRINTLSWTPSRQALGMPPRVGVTALVVHKRRTRLAGGVVIEAFVSCAQVAYLEVPVPGCCPDGLPHGPQDPQRGAVVLLHPLLAVRLQRSDEGGAAVKLPHLQGSREMGPQAGSALCMQGSHSALRM